MVIIFTSLFSLFYSHNFDVVIFWGVWLLYFFFCTHFCFSIIFLFLRSCLFPIPVFSLPFLLLHNYYYYFYPSRSFLSPCSFLPLHPSLTLLSFPIISCSPPSILFPPLFLPLHPSVFTLLFPLLLLCSFFLVFYFPVFFSYFFIHYFDLTYIDF